MVPINNLERVMSWAGAPGGGSFGASLQPGQGQLPSGKDPGGDRGAGGSLAGLRVLIVEDDTDARELVTAVLVDAGAVVESACSVAEGFEAVHRFRPELLVSDIAMPGEDGYSLMRRVRALGSAEGGAVPAIALSAFTRAEDRLAALRAGFSLHIGKPVFPADLVYAAEALVALMRYGTR